jgi:uncharacterized membrane protein (UPF0182 family)
VIQKRRRGALVPTLITIGVLIVIGLLFAQFYTDVLWYRSVGFFGVYRTEALTKLVMFVIGFLLMAGAVAASLLIAYRGRPIYAPVSTEQAGLDRYRESIEPLRRVVSLAVPVVLGLFAGSAASQQWQTVQLWWHRTPFGTKDPQFKMDVGFFVFTLPWLQFIVGFLTAVVFLSALAALATHYLYGGLRLQVQGQRLTSVARIHLSALAAAFLLLRGVDYWLGRFALSTKDSRLITGLTYTDANAVLTARGVLAGIAVVVAILFLVTAAVDRWRLIPLFGVALLVVCAIVIGGIYPAAIQRFQVTPNAKRLEGEFIQRNIKATRDAYGLTGIQATSYSAQSEAEPATLRAAARNVPGIRLVDPSLVSDTYRQLQQLRPYYSFPESLDVDRYQVEGQTRDAVIALREMDLAAAPAAQRNWINDHTVYTHGYGVVAAYGNERNPDGTPVFFQSGIVGTGALGEYEQRIYFGEKSPDYSIVGAPAGAQKAELDFPDDTGPGQQNTTYNGDGGVSVGSLFNKLLYAVKFRDGNILLSSQVNEKSKILYDRNPRDRVEKVAPFLTLDGDPYPAVVGGRIQWILDGYTTSAGYPYSRSSILEDATSDSITNPNSNVVALQNQRVNYMRNSVKATVDAYTGEVSLYTWDEEDPVLKTWSKVFPKALKPLSSIQGDLMAHLRYPEDLFKVQRELLQRYHVDDASSFFDQQDFWTVPDDPARTSDQLQPPYYLSLQMPGTNAATFSLTSSFIPAGGTRNVLTGYMAVDADAGSQTGVKRPGYGQLRLLKLPKDTVVPGPGQVQNNFNTDADVSSQLNILQRGSTTVTRGNLLTLPFGGGLLYVQPVYVRSSGGGTSYPLLQKVLVAFGGKEIGYADTLQEALDQVFGKSSGDDDAGGGGTTPPAPGGAPPSAAQQRLDTALDTAGEAIRESDNALKAGDFAAYGKAQDKLQKAVEDAEAASRQVQAARPAATPAPSASAAPSPTPSPSG